MRKERMPGIDRTQRAQREKLWQICEAEDATISKVHPELHQTLMLLQQRQQDVSVPLALHCQRFQP